MVIITTKSGKNAKKGKPQISFSTSLSMDKMSRKPELQSTYAQGSGGKYQPTGQSSWGPLISELANDPTYGGNANGHSGKYYVQQFGKANGTAYFYLNGNANPYNANAFDTKYLYHNKAFLIETPDINASALRVCVPVFSNMSSGINNVYVDDDKGPIYDLLGRKVKKPKRGVYIQKIKKIKELKN